MGTLVSIFSPLHAKTSRDYIGRMVDNKPEAMRVARQYGQEFWDGSRRYGYGGYTYDGRYAPVARAFIERYSLPSHARILDVGCGKGYVLFEFMKLLPQAQVRGFDISRYAIEHAKEEVKPYLSVADAAHPFPYQSKEFDLVISAMTLHNLQVSHLQIALSEIERVGRSAYVSMESFRNETELFNLQCWALTCNSFYAPSQWEWLFTHFGYSGDYEFLYFE